WSRAARWSARPVKPATSAGSCLGTASARVSSRAGCPVSGALVSHGPTTLSLRIAVSASPQLPGSTPLELGVKDDSRPTSSVNIRQPPAKRHPEAALRRPPGYLEGKADNERHH